MKLVTVFTLGVALALTAGAAQAQGQGGQGRPGFGGGRGPGGGGFFGGPGGGGLGMLLQMPEVQAELKVDATQKELLDQLNMENRDKMRQLFQGGGFGRPGGGAPDPAAQEEFRKKMTAMQAEQTKAIGEVLDAKQLARLKQLSLQREGTRAIGRPEVQDQLKLSADQRQKITAAFNGEREAMQTLFQGFRPQEGQPPSEEQRAEFGKKMQAARAAADAGALAVLTDAQKTQFKALQGAPFKFPEGGFGFGGPGGRGPGGRPGGQRQNN